MSNPICLALDGMDKATADRTVLLLEEHVGAFKVGLELFVRSQELPKTKRPIILDLKLHDIPNTVASAVAAGGDRGASFMTLHIQQRAALEAAVKAAEPFKMTLLGVTVLTSMDVPDMQNLGYEEPTLVRRVERLASFGYSCGLRGFVCSPQEVGSLRLALTGTTETFFLVPGVRPAGAALGDQKRVGTPGQAVRDGASLIVVGRPILQASDPVAAAKSILEEVSNHA